VGASLRDIALTIKVMKKRITLSVEGKITKSKEKIVVEMFNNFGKFIREMKKDGMKVETISVTSKDVLDLE